jgi:hypothetical protein
MAASKRILPQFLSGLPDPAFRHEYLTHKYHKALEEKPFPFVLLPLISASWLNLY